MKRALLAAALVAGCFSPPSRDDRKRVREVCAEHKDFDDEASTRAFEKLEAAGCKRGLLASCEGWFDRVVAACAYEKNGKKSLEVHFHGRITGPRDYVEKRNEICDMVRAHVTRTAVASIVDNRGFTVTKCGGRKED